MEIQVLYLHRLLTSDGVRRCGTSAVNFLFLNNYTDEKNDIVFIDAGAGSNGALL